MGMRKICAMMVPRNLTDQNWDARLSAIFTSKCITVMLLTPTVDSNSQAPYSTDLATCDFFLFQKVKTALKEQHFESTEEIQKSVKQGLNDIPQNVFLECYKKWQPHWKCWVKIQVM
jgi:hypothetical protein